MKFSTIGRCIITLALIYGVYTETGIFTALSFFCVFVGTELEAVLKKGV